MSYTLACQPGDGCIRIRMEGPWPRRNTPALMAEIFRLWDRHGRRPLVLDLRHMDDSPSVLEDYETARRFAEAGFRQLGGIAVLDKPERREANDFFETAASNRGLSFRFFYSGEEEAVAWLPVSSDSGGAATTGKEDAT